MIRSATDPPAVPARGCYVYGVVPRSARPDIVDEPGGEIAVVPHGTVGALVRRLTDPAELTRRRGLIDHSRVLDRVAATTAVLPMRFGTVVADPESVREEMLIPHHDRFARALAELEGHAQFTLRASYVADQVVREVLADEPRALRLHQRLRSRGNDYGERVRLGELVAQGVAARREADAATLAETLRPHARTVRVQVSQAPDLDRAADATCFVDLRRRPRFEAAAERLGRHWHGRVRLRLLGPMAAYHFVDDLVGALSTAGR